LSFMCSCGLEARYGTQAAFFKKTRKKNGDKTVKYALTNAK